MQDKPFCSLLVLNFNGLEHLGECFGSLSKLDYPKGCYEVIMVDNGSTDGSVAFVRKHFRRVKLLKLGKNYGFAEGNNRGLRAAKGKYIVFLNNDTKVAPHWLSGLVDTANISKDIGICGSKVFDQKLGTVIGEGRLSLLGVPDITSRHAKATECFFVSGASMLVKRKVLKRLGQCFDTEFFAYFEDVDLCWRAKLAGYKVMYAPASEVVHKGGATSKPKPGQKPRSGMMKFYHYRNKIWTFRRNTRPPLTQIVMAPIALSTLLASVCLSLTGEWKYGITALKHMFDKKEKSAEVRRVSLKEQLKLFRI